jgi:hypothetical protein
MDITTETATFGSLFYAVLSNTVTSQPCMLQMSPRVTRSAVQNVNPWLAGMVAGNTRCQSAQDNR